MKEIKILFQTFPQRTLAPDGFTNELYGTFMDETNLRQKLDQSKTRDCYKKEQIPGTRNIQQKAFLHWEGS